MSFQNDDNNTRNLVIAVFAFLAVSFLVDYFFGTKNVSESVPEQSQQVRSAVTTSEATSDRRQNSSADKSARSDSEEPLYNKVSEALAASHHVYFENPKIQGAVNLSGGAIDCVWLKDYKESTEKDSPAAMVLSPRKYNGEYYFSIEYHDHTNNRIISEDINWEPIDDHGEDEAKLRMRTPDGLVVQRSVSIDDGYLIVVRDRLKNSSKKAISLSKKSSLIRRNPKVLNYAVVHEGGVGNIDGKIEEIKYDKLNRSNISNDSSWFGFCDVYWLCAMINKDSSLSCNRFGDVYRSSFEGRNNVVVQPGANIELTYTLFVGPKNINILDKYGKEQHIDKFDMAIDFGWFVVITKPLTYFMEFLHKLFGNMGLVILLLTILFRMATYPLMKKSFISIAKMKKIQPKIAQLQKFYSNDKLRMNQELVSLYRKENISPLSGCLPMLLQAPIFFCLYKVFFISIAMRHAPLFGWVKDLAAPDHFYLFNLFGLIDWTPPSFLQIGLWPLIMGASMMLQQKLSSMGRTASGVKTPEQRMQENMMYIMPIFFTFICASFPVGIVVYWTVSNVIGILQQKYVNKKYSLS